MISKQNKIAKEELERLLEHPPDSADFMFNEVKAYLDSLIKAIQSLRTKAILMIGFLLSGVAFCVRESKIAFLAKDPPLWYQIYGQSLIIYAMIFLGIAAILVWKTFFPKDRYGIGESLKTFADYKQIYPITALKINQARFYMDRFEDNAKYLRVLSGAITTCLYAIIVAMVAVPILVFIFSFLMGYK